MFALNLLAMPKNRRTIQLPSQPQFAYLPIAFGPWIPSGRRTATRGIRHIQHSAAGFGVTMWFYSMPFAKSPIGRMTNSNDANRIIAILYLSFATSGHVLPMGFWTPTPDGTVA